MLYFLIGYAIGAITWPFAKEYAYTAVDKIKAKF